MKTTPVSILALGILSSHFALAEAPARKDRPQGDSPRHNFMEAWKKADQNNDGSLSLDEFSSLPRLQAIPEEKRAQLFQRLDKDGNNLITREEMQRMGHPNQGGPNHHKRLWELDTDKNGKITREEFSAGEMFRKLPPEKQQKLFDRLDTNQDGVISPDDRPQRPNHRPGENRPRNQQPDDKDSPRRPVLFPRLDTNGDGFLDFNEFSKMPGISRLGEDEQEQAFNKIDTNQDLKISPEEMAAFRPMVRGSGKGPNKDRQGKVPPRPVE